MCPVVSGCVRVSGGILPCPLGVQGSGVGCHQKNAIGVAHSHHPRSRFALQTSPARTRRGCCGRCGRCGRRGPQSRATQHSKTQKQSRGKMHHSALSDPKVRTNKKQNKTTISDFVKNLRNFPISENSQGICALPGKHGEWMDEETEDTPEWPRREKYPNLAKLRTLGTGGACALLPGLSLGVLS